MPISDKTFSKIHKKPFEIWVKRLIKKKNVDTTPNKMRVTPLMICAWRGYTDIARLLLDNHANINLKNKYDRTALSIAAQLGHTDMVSLFLEHNADVETKSTYGSTPLIFAAAYGHTEAVALLIKAKSNIEAQTKNNRETALGYAANNGKLKVVSLLLQHKANLEARDLSERTPLMLAADNGQLEIVSLLLQNNANVNSRDIRDDTALLLAATNGHTEVVKLLLDNNAQVNIPNKYGTTALMEASHRGHKEIVALLLARGANLNLRDNTGMQALTPWLIENTAKHGKYGKEMATLLISKGADFSSHTIIYKDCIMKAVQRCYDENRPQDALSLLEKAVDLYPATSYPKLAKQLRSHLASHYYNLYLNTTNSEYLERALAHALTLKSGFLDRKTHAFKLEITTAYLNNKQVKIRSPKWIKTHIEPILNQSHNQPTIAYKLINQYLDEKKPKEDMRLAWALLKKQKKIAIRIISKGADVSDYIKECEPIILNSIQLCFNEKLLKEAIAMARRAINLYPNMTLQIHDMIFDVLKNPKLPEKQAQEIINALATHNLLNLKNSSGEPLLVMAARHGYIKILSMLVQKGADVNITAMDGDTALIRAAHIGRNDIIDLLLKNKADINMRGAWGNTPLMVAVQNGDPKIVARLLRVSNININAKNQSHRTALILCAGGSGQDSQEILKLLLDHGADINYKINAPDPTNQLTSKPFKTALEYAIKYKGLEYSEIGLKGLEQAKNRSKKIALLISRKADISDHISECEPFMMDSIQLCFDEKRPGDAISLLEQCINLYPNLAQEAHLKLATYYLNVPSPTLVQSNEVQSLDEDSPTAKTNLEKALLHALAIKSDPIKSDIKSKIIKQHLLENPFGGSIESEWFQNILAQSHKNPLMAFEALKRYSSQKPYFKYKVSAEDASRIEQELLPITLHNIVSSKIIKTKPILPSEDSDPDIEISFQLANNYLTEYNNPHNNKSDMIAKALKACLAIPSNDEHGFYYRFKEQILSIYFSDEKGNSPDSLPRSILELIKTSHQSPELAYNILLGDKQLQSKPDNTPAHFVFSEPLPPIKNANQNKSIPIPSLKPKIKK